MQGRNAAGSDDCDGLFFVTVRPRACEGPPTVTCLQQSDIVLEIDSGDTVERGLNTWIPGGCPYLYGSYEILNKVGSGFTASLDDSDTDIENSWLRVTEYGIRDDGSQRFVDVKVRLFQEGCQDGDPTCEGTCTLRFNVRAERVNCPSIKLKEIDDVKVEYGDNQVIVTPELENSGGRWDSLDWSISEVSTSPVPADVTLNRNNGKITIDPKATGDKIGVINIILEATASRTHCKDSTAEAEFNIIVEPPDDSDCDGPPDITCNRVENISFMAGSGNSEERQIQFTNVGCPYDSVRYEIASHTGVGYIYEISDAGVLHITENNAVADQSQREVTVRVTAVNEGEENSWSDFCDVSVSIEITEFVDCPKIIALDDMSNLSVDAGGNSLTFRPSYSTSGSIDWLLWSASLVGGNKELISSLETQSGKSGNVTITTIEGKCVSGNVDVKVTLTAQKEGCNSDFKNNTYTVAIKCRTRTTTARDYRHK